MTCSETAASGNSLGFSTLGSSGEGEGDFFGEGVGVGEIVGFRVGKTVTSFPGTAEAEANSVGVGENGGVGLGETIGVGRETIVGGGEGRATIRFLASQVCLIKKTPTGMMTRRIRRKATTKTCL